MKLNTVSGEAVTVSEVAFGREYNEALVHQVVNAFLAAGRQGSVAQKTRSQVSGGGKKPWRQKGTGRARAGTIRSPLWKGGGVTFAAEPRSYEQKVNRKMYRGALSCILSELLRQERLVVVESFDLDQPKTKLVVSKLGELGASSCLIVGESVSNNVYLATRNLHGVDVRDVQAVDPVSLIAYDKVVITVGALKVFEEMLS